MTETIPEITDELRDGILWITLQRPAARNALTFGMYERLAQICADMPTDGSVRAVVISGAGGKAFAAGTDMTQFRAFETAQDALEYEHRIDAVLDAVERCPVPTIAAINGACTGGGGSIAAACDIRIASASLKFGFPIARTLGNCLAAGNLARLSELIGAGRVRELIFTARLIEAQEAMPSGSSVKSCPTKMPCWRVRRNWPIMWDQWPPSHCAPRKKRCVATVRHFRVEDSDLIVSCYMSEDFRTGMEAFLGKTKPIWKGK